MIKEKDVETKMLKKCLIGYVKELESVQRLLEICKMEGLPNVEVKYIGGLLVGIILENEQTTENIIANEEHGIRKWMEKIKRWDKGFVYTVRMSWISIIRVPLTLRNE